MFLTRCRTVYITVICCLEARIKTQFDDLMTQGNRLQARNDPSSPSSATPCMRRADGRRDGPPPFAAAHGQASSDTLRLFLDELPGLTLIHRVTPAVAAVLPLDVGPCFGFPTTDRHGQQSLWKVRVPSLATLESRRPRLPNASVGSLDCVDRIGWLSNPTCDSGLRSRPPRS